MPISFDVASSLNISPTAASGVWSHTIASNANLLVVGLSIITTTSTGTSITYNGVNLNKVISVNNGTTNRSETWYLSNPATGTHNIVANLSATSKFIGGGVSYIGAHSSSPIGVSGSNTGTDTTPNISLTTANNNSWIFNTVVNANNSTAYTPAAPNTNRWNATTTGGSAASNIRGVGNDRTTGIAGTYNASGTLAISRAYAITACEIKENYTYSQSFMM